MGHTLTHDLRRGGWGRARARLDTRLGARQAWAWEGRELLRKKLVGRDVTFRVDYSIPTTGREFGTVFLGSENITHTLIREGLVRVRDNKGKYVQRSRPPAAATCIAALTRVGASGLRLLPWPSGRRERVGTTSPCSSSWKRRPRRPVAVCMAATTTRSVLTHLVHQANAAGH